ncbi:hypothetical protein GWK47_018385 [Chionoecetes opilio]|uniref:Uncharacterized protein n=1 Tax=Chionoecetes opilio TaxID=41210 RepID=A0A8J4XQS4_CHIOP|nr:hypothetical protein GWK47_018385 [Chionoecetes opilio]
MGDPGRPASSKMAAGDDTSLIQLSENCPFPRKKSRLLQLCASTDYGKRPTKKLFVADSKAILMGKEGSEGYCTPAEKVVHPQTVREMINIIMAELTKRFWGIERGERPSEAAPLDLRFKKHAIIHEKHEQDAVTR